jgi:hypothetical protein
MKQYDLDCELELMNIFVQLGRTAKLKHVINRSGALFQGDKRQKKFDRLVQTLEMMEDFEQKYGRGSCINLQDPIVLQATIDDPHVWKPDEVENAKKAPMTDRMKILALAA